MGIILPFPVVVVIILVAVMQGPVHEARDYDDDDKKYPDNKARGARSGLDYSGNVLDH
jgi:hypothetical protein